MTQKAAVLENINKFVKRSWSINKTSQRATIIYNRYEEENSSYFA